MANSNVRHYTTIAFILVLALASASEAGEADCSDVVSPISGLTLRELIERSIELGARRSDLDKLIQRSRCRLYIENLLDTHKHKKEPFTWQIQ